MHTRIVAALLFSSFFVAHGSALGAGPPVVPSGALLPFAGSTAPAGYLLCDGSAVSRVTYASLFAVIGTTYGAGDGSTTFNLPDLRGRAVFGKDDMGGTTAGVVTSSGSGINGTQLGALGGNEYHVLTLNEMPSHGHAVNDPGHGHSLTLQLSLAPPAYNSLLTNDHGLPSSQVVQGDPCNAFEGNCGPGMVFNDWGHWRGNQGVETNLAANGSVNVQSASANTSATGVSVGSTGGGQLHPIMPPAVILNYIIRQ
jgi:microcystin-dependent protein